MPITIQNLPFQNVVASGVAIASLKNAIGSTLQRLVLQLGGTTFTKAMIALIEIKANGKVIFSQTGSVIDARMKYRGIYDTAAFLTIDFTEVKARTIVGMEQGAIDTSAGINDLTCEVTISGATAPTLVGVLVLAGPQVDEKGASLPYRGILAKVLKYPASYSAGGTQSFDLPSGDKIGARIKRIVFESTVMTALQIKKNGFEIFNRTTAQNEFIQRENGRVPQTGFWVVDFIESNNQSDALNTRDANLLEIYPTLSGAGTVNAHVEYYDLLVNN